MKPVYSQPTVLGLALVSALMLSAHSAFAMPCDTGYQCTSKTGKYQIALQRCRYENDLRLESATINNVQITPATLGPAYDGNSILAFEVVLPPTGGADQRKLSVEISRKGHAGVIREQVQEVNPSPYKTVATEAISCEITE